MLAELFAVMAPVLIVAGIGYAWVRSGQAYPTDFVARLVLNIGTPCLVLSSLSRTEVDAQAFGQMALACVVVSVLMGLIGVVLSRTLAMDWKVLVPAYLFPNTGNMGLPISLYAFGEHGLALAVAFFLMLSVGHFTLGMILSGAEPSWRKLLVNPIILSLGAALVVMLFDLELPRWLANTVNLLSGTAIPMMLITLGVSLASIRVQHLGRGMLLGALRILCGGGVGWLIGHLLDLPPLAQAVLVLQSAMPVAVFNYLFAVRANRSPEEVASLVMCSTLLSFVVLPLLLVWLLPTVR
ncbi:AEC family transporter [Pseudomonas sp. MAP12]|uniref:AEC family transporter n=1 Tax=Geopseudomonas aromaticivorans TaxID=2849492 RepID=A0ABS6MWF1_9GAMM|nr:AEC family transporter [Pseudomonas aromaticivorans]MBV2133060.1 AEC family transporter [Pseudomonas aromaticivorans]